MRKFESCCFNSGADLWQVWYEPFVSRHDQVAPRPLLDNRTTYRHSHGWQVRFPRSMRAPSRFFSDRRFGGLKAAFKAAVAYRDEVMGEPTV